MMLHYCTTFKLLVSTALVPPASSIPLNDAASSKDKHLLRLPVGHVELGIGVAAHEKLWSQAVEWLKQRSQGSVKNKAQQ